MKLVLPWPPATNNLYAVVRGRKIKSAAGRKYNDAVYAAWLMHRDRRKFGGARVRVRIGLSQPTRRNIDLDGRLKALLDALTHCGAWEDDSQIDELLVRREGVVKGGLVEVEILEL